MINGEHAVVYGAPAIVCAIEQHIHIHLTTRNDRAIHIRSALAEHHTGLDALTDHPALRFILTALHLQTPACGLDLDIHSDINPTLGLGSSAAVTVAMTALLSRLRDEPMDLLTLHEKAHRTILQVQQRGSGADLAASLTGGMLAYQNQPQTHISPLPPPPAILSLRYAGYKTPTAEVLARIAARAQDRPEYYRDLYAHMAENSAHSIAAAQQQDWQTFYRALNNYQTLLEQLGVCDETQAAHIAAARQHAHAVKISGSGLGDCILALSAQLPPEHNLVHIATQGITL